ncbi:inter-alpha-trypsin inhibitor heavy chain H3-like [Lepeophtheirus salmonis]|uniref:inter-alpha-trypsin inhibitor heavy chain H3-like n=1 Tax=Lepeophtheirus salmonis TaxID=72036 RepID=UPI001AE9F39E|nr:inter-alpha-trypsin inhibitor heavy chain H3-like [Lepeophtheirus salmonis]
MLVTKYILHRMLLLTFLIYFGLFCLSSGRPSGTTVSTLELNVPIQKIIFSEMEIVSDIQFRYAKTKISAYFKNPSSTKSQEASFTIQLPDEAFISNLSMILSNGEEFVSNVKEKEVAKKEYDSAVSSGTSAGLVSASLKNSNKDFTVESNVEPKGKVRFIITYEELLPRTRSYYEHGVNLDTRGYIIPEYTITVNINESLPISYLNVPEILNQNNLVDYAKGSKFLSKNEEAVVKRNVDDDPSKANIFLRLSPEYQQNNSLKSSRFVVRYDVDRKEENEIQVIDGYFVHFIVPKGNGNVLPKYVVFVLDVSGSMQGTKIDQMKDAMITIIDELGPEDRFNILTFSDDVWNWVPSKDEGEPIKDFESGVTSYPATDLFKEEALKFIFTLIPISGTNINGGMLKGLEMIQNVSLQEEIKYGTAKMLLFLTDGQATSGETDSSRIVSNVVTKNSDIHALIYGLAFGEGADFDLIKTTSTSNGGFARRIHAGADAALQLENFFTELSSPLLSDVKVKYVGDTAQNFTEPTLRTFFKNEEFIVVGKLRDPEPESLSFTLNAKNSVGDLNKTFTLCLRAEEWQIMHHDLPLPGHCINPIHSKPPQSPSQNFIERLWAFKTIKSLLLNYNNQLKSEVPNKTEIELSKKQALDLSIKYNFVTPFTSMVVIKDTFDLSLDELPVLNNRGYGILPSNRLFFSNPIARRGSTRRNGPSGPLSTTTTTRYSYTTSNLIAYDLEDADFYDDFDTTSMSSPPQQNKTVTPCHGNITLFTKTYLRGENITLISDEEADLGGFKLVSLNVEGSCCWRVFNQVDFKGNSEFFQFSHSRSGDGAFNSALEMKDVFRKASSIKKAVCS